MNETFLQVTFRNGRALAAYYYLPRTPGQRSVRTVEMEPGILVDYSKAGTPMGIEITRPQTVSLAAMNRVLSSLGFPRMKRGELAPLRAA